MSDVRGSDLFPMVRGFEPVGRCVCLLEGKSGPIGTGFLIGPDRVMTAAHVVGLLVALRAVDELICTFELEPETCRVTATEMFVPKPKDPFQPPTPETLDFAILRLDHPVGVHRGWLDLGATTPRLGDIVTVLQHPNGGEMRWSTGPVTAFTTGDTRIRYGASTRRISSGSPVLGHDLRVVAMHTDEGTGENEGVLIRAIRSRIDRG